MKLEVTGAILSEGYCQFVGGVIIQRRFTGVEKVGEDRYLVDEPSPPPDEPSEGIPIVDVRTSIYKR